MAQLKTVLDLMMANSKGALTCLNSFWQMEAVLKSIRTIANGFFLGEK
jgi:hypothetical protein